jgi:hypothetical protein
MHLFRQYRHPCTCSSEQKDGQHMVWFSLHLDIMRKKIYVPIDKTLFLYLCDGCLVAAGKGLKVCSTQAFFGNIDLEEVQ